MALPETLSGQKWHNNPRQISEKQFAQLKEWLEELGDLSGVVHDLTTNQYVGGNQRSAVFGQAEVVLTETFAPPTRTGTVALGYILHEGERYQYRQVRWDEEKCRKANIVANSAGGTWDMDVLANEWGGLPLAEWGVPVPEDWLKEEPPAEEEGSNIALPDEPLTCVGDLYELNGHRVQCGDSLDSLLIDKLMGEADPYMVFTDPPYGFDFDDIQSLFARYYDKLNIWMLDDVNVVKLSALHIDRFFGAFVWIAGNKNIVSNKQPIRTTVLMPCFNYHAVKSYNDNYTFHYEHGRQSSLIHEFGTGHIKPIELYELHIDHLTLPGAGILDYFLHSGTCLLACERLGRTCYGQELEPKYVDVAVRRWLRYMKENNRPFTAKRNGLALSEEELARLSQGPLSPSLNQHKWLGIRNLQHI